MNGWTRVDEPSRPSRAHAGPDELFPDPSCGVHPCVAPGSPGLASVRSITCPGRSVAQSDALAATTPVVAGPVRVAWLPENRRISVRGQLDLLGALDRDRAQGLPRARRKRFVLGRLLVRGLVDGLFPDATGWTVVPGRCARCGGRQAGVGLEGVPAVASIAYADGRTSRPMSLTDEGGL